METLKKIFNIQRKQNSRWWNQERFEVDKIYRKDVVMNHCMGMIEQTTALLNNFDWKKYTLSQQENIHNAIEQSIDVIKYSLGLLIMLGIDEEIFVEEFINKSEILEYKWKQNELDLANDSVVVFDLDGVVCNWELSIAKFYFKDKHINKVLRNEILNDRENRKSYNIKDWLKISASDEEQLKDAFVKSGGFRYIEHYQGALQAIEETQKLGVKVVCITARSYGRNKREIGRAHV